MTSNIDRRSRHRRRIEASIVDSLSNRSSIVKSMTVNVNSVLTSRSMSPDDTADDIDSLIGDRVSINRKPAKHRAVDCIAFLKTICYVVKSNIDMSKYRGTTESPGFVAVRDKARSIAKVSRIKPTAVKSSIADRRITGIDKPRVINYGDRGHNYDRYVNRKSNIEVDHAAIKIDDVDDASNDVVFTVQLKKPTTSPAKPAKPSNQATTSKATSVKSYIKPSSSRQSTIKTVKHSNRFDTIDRPSTTRRSISKSTASMIR